MLTVAAIMDARRDGSADGEVRADARIAAVAARLREATAPLAVVDAEGRRVGTLTRDAVADVMLGGDGDAARSSTRLRLSQPHRSSPRTRDPIFQTNAFRTRIRSHIARRSLKSGSPLARG